MARKAGQHHHRAKLTDHDVELIRQLHDDGIGYLVLAKKFEVSQHTIGRICRFERRTAPVKGAHKPA